MRYVYKFISTIVLVLTITATASAQSQPTIQIGNAYSKGKNSYDVIVKDPAGIKLRLYVNDKNPVNATGNKKSWATFHKVNLNGKGKLSFVQVQERHNGSTYETPLTYTSLYTTNNGRVAFSSPNSNPAPVVTAPAPKVVVPAPRPEQPVQPVAQPPTSVNTGTTDTNLSNNSTYTNVDGTTVHSPATSTDGTVPAGATAQCADGTYSFSQNHSGTCSRHGGVSQWL